MKKVLLSVLVVVAALATFGETAYYWNPTVKGAYYYQWNNENNWLDADGKVPTSYPNSADAIVYITSKAQDIGQAAGKCAAIIWKKVSTTLTQGTLTLVAGGHGLDLTEASGSPSAYCALNMDGSGEVVADVGTYSLAFQKDFTGENAILVKRGSANLTLANDYPRAFSAKGLRLENGTVKFGYLKPHSGANGFDLSFSGNEGTQVLTLTTNLIVKSLVIHEVNDVTNTTHGIKTTGGFSIQHVGGTAAVASSDFSGTLSGNIGVMWKPYSADTEFIFRKAKHTTTGALVVSNGVIRVADGASFGSVSGVEVSGATSTLAVDVEGMTAFPSAPIMLNDGGSVAVSGGKTVVFASVAVGGQPVADGLYKPVGSTVLGTEATWVTGDGRVLVGALPEAEAVAAEWNGQGADANASTEGNWADGKPALDDGSAVVSVTGGSSFVADENVWAKGFSLGVGSFALAAAAGRELWIGSAGIVNTANGAVTVGSADGEVMVSANETWDVGGGTLTVAGPVKPFGSVTQEIKGTGRNVLNLNVATPDWVHTTFITNLWVKFNASGALGPNCGTFAYIYHNASGYSPTYADGVTVERDLWVIDGSKAKEGSTKIVVPENGNVTFNGIFQTSNTCSIVVDAGKNSTVTFNKLLMSRNGGGFKGSGRVVCKGPIHFRDRPGMEGTVTVELHVGENRLNGNLGTFKGGTLKAMAPYVITKANKQRFTTANVPNNSTDGAVDTMINSKDNFVLDLNGFDQSIDQLAMHANVGSGGGHVTSATAATLHLQTDKSYWAKHNYTYGFSDTSYSTDDGYGYETVDKGSWEGGVTLSYEATDKAMRRSMMCVSSSTGNVEVVSGTLVFLRRAKTANETFDLKGGSSNPYKRLTDRDGAWTNATKAVVSGGTLILEHGKAFGKNVAFELNSKGKLQLEEGVRQWCASLTTNGVAAAVGTYGSSQSDAMYKDDACFTGPGVLKVGDFGMVILIR